MSVKYLSGKEVSEAVLDQALKDADELIAQGTQPTLAIVRAGEDPGSLSYEKSIINRMRKSHINVMSIVLPEDVDEEKFESVIEELNEDDAVQAVLIFQPLPAGVDGEKIKFILAPEKDVDSMNPANLGKMMAGDETGFVPCTAEGVMTMLDYYDIPVKGQDVTVINNSNVLGKPLGILLTNEFATVSLAHVFTKDLEKYTKDADIIISGAGVYGLLKPEMVKDGAVVIDVAMSQMKDDDGNFVLNDEGKKIRTGDLKSADWDKLSAVTSATPGLGGGTGPITTALLARNVIKAAKLQQKRKEESR